jgi:pimeloyl-ACP methyl ester carboxylesterase
MSSRNILSDQEKPSLLLITGWAHGKEAMQPLADALSADYDIQILTGAQVLKDRSIPPADYIITGSMGGLLALEHLPESCRKLILISSTARFCSDEGYPCGTPEKVLRRMIIQIKRNPEAVLEEFFKNVHYPHEECRRSFPLRSDAIVDSASSTEQEAPSTLPALVAGLEYLRDSDVRARIPAISIPILLLHGADDRIIPSAAAEWLHDHLPDSRLRIFEKNGHALLAHHFDKVMCEISCFLKPSRKLS